MTIPSLVRSLARSLIRFLYGISGVLGLFSAAMLLGFSIQSMRGNPVDDFPAFPGVGWFVAVGVGLSFAFVSAFSFVGRPGKWEKLANVLLRGFLPISIALFLGGMAWSKREPVSSMLGVGAMWFGLLFTLHLAARHRMRSVVDPGSREGAAPTKDARKHEESSRSADDPG